MGRLGEPSLPVIEIEDEFHRKQRGPEPGTQTPRHRSSLRLSTQSSARAGNVHFAPRSRANHGHASSCSGLTGKPARKRDRSGFRCSGPLSVASGTPSLSSFCCSACHIGHSREPARINRPYSIIIGRCCPKPIICVGGDIGGNISDEGKH